MQVEAIGEELKVWLSDEEIVQLALKGVVHDIGRPLVKGLVVVHIYNDLPDPANAAFFHADGLTLNLPDLKLPAYISPNHTRYRPKDHRYAAGMTVGAARERTD